MMPVTKPGLAVFYDHARAPDMMGDAQRDGLAPFRLLTPEPVAEPGDLPDSVLAEIELIISGWGCPRLDEPLLDRMPKLRFVAHTGSAVKPIVSPAFWSRGIRISSAAAANARPVAEYALAAILWANKQVLPAREFYRDKGQPQRYPWTAPDTPGNCGPTIGIVGASRTGRHLMSLLSHFDMTVLLADPYADAAEWSDSTIRLVERQELAALSDVVSLHAPLTDETHGMIDAAFLARMKQGATLVNTGRGGLVDQDALIAALRRGRIFAVLDVTEPEPLPPGSPLLSLPNAFVTPHVAGAAGYETRRLIDLAISEALRFHLGEPLLHEVTQRRAEQFG
jgi:phosphoglycerate dehydrogenase-like enzyme